MTLSYTPSVSFSDLMSTIASYFGLNTEFAQREAEATEISIQINFFLVFNLQNVGFFDVSGKTLTVPDPAVCPADLTYFTFRSFVFVATVDIRTSALSLFLDFLLRLLQSLSTSASHSTVLPKTSVNPALVTTPQKPIEDLSFKIGNFSDDILYDMGVDQI